MELDRPFLRLPHHFDAARLGEDLQGLSDEAWVPHPSGLEGNTAVPLVSINGELKDGFDGQMSWKVFPQVTNTGRDLWLTSW